MDWQALWTTLGSISIGAGLIYFLARALIKQGLTLHLERFKSDLRAAAFERETRYALLHQRRAEIIARMYELLITAEMEITELMEKGVQQESEEERNRMIKAAAAMKEFLTFYRKNEIYFEEALCRKLKEFSKELRKVYIDYGFQAMQHLSSSITDRAYQEGLERLDTEVPAVREEILTAFREILGLKKDQRTT